MMSDLIHINVKSELQEISYIFAPTRSTSFYLIFMLFFNSERFGTAPFLGWMPQSIFLVHHMYDYHLY